MNRPIDDEGDYYERRADPDRADREISLGTTTILGIFFGLAVVCACFFGFGYTMGHNSARAAEAAGSTVGEPAVVTPAGGAAKPAAGSLAVHPVAPVAQVADDGGSAAAEGAEKTAVAVAPAPAKNAVAASDRVIAGDKVPVTPVALPVAASTPVVGAYMVQVAAVSSQDVADILLASLEKKGYKVAVHHEAQDKLLHVQIGPFGNRKDAEAMQKRVLGDGFNAIVK
ncbi:MAG TPA: SPOR domain-containing protein [Acidobacteriaceae bacterium]|nr:SPOR domain-containing protein [Acidobacteriaceae bacterium]